MVPVPIYCLLLPLTLVALPQDSRTDSYGDAIPKGALRRLGTVRFRHDGEVSDIAYSPDGKTIASCTETGKVHLWEATTGKEVARLLSDIKGVEAIAFSPDGKALAAGGWGDEKVTIWDLPTRRRLTELKTGSSFVTSMAFSPDGVTLALGTYQSGIRIFNTFTGKRGLALPGHTDMVNAVAYSPDGRTLLSGSRDGMVRTWDLETGKEILKIEVDEEGVNDVAFLPDGRSIASAGQEDGIRVWDAASGKDFFRLEPPERWIPCLAPSPDGKKLAAADWDEVIRLWDAATGKERGAAPDQAGVVGCVAFSPDGRLLASGGIDRGIRLWDPATGRQVGLLKGGESPVTSVDFSRDGRHLASISEEFLRVWDLSTGEVVHRIETSYIYHYAGVACSPDGKSVAAWGDVNWVRKWTIQGQEPREEWAAQGAKGHGTSYGTGRTYLGWSNALAFSPDGTLIAALTGKSWDEVPDQNAIVLYRAGDGSEHLRLRGHSEPVYALAFSPDGRLLASGGRGDTILLWEMATGGILREMDGHGKTITTLAFSPDGQLLVSGGWSEEIRLWEVETGKTARTLTGHFSDVSSVAFSPDGRILASGSGDTTVLLWDLSLLKPLEGPETVHLLVGRMEAVWSELAGEDPTRAWAAVRSLALFPDDSIPFLRARLTEVNDSVERKMEDLIRALDDDDFAVREGAEEGLRRLGDRAVPAMEKALEGGPSPEVQVRLRRVIDGLSLPFRSFPSAPLRRFRAIHALESMGSPEAIDLLETLHETSSWKVEKVQARAALERLAARGEREP